MNRKTIAFSNQKGGVGKSTCTRELGICLAASGKNVLLVDADPQANLTKSLTDENAKGLFEALSDMEYELRKIQPGLSLLAGDIKLALLEKSLIGELDAYVRLKELLQEDVFTEYDLILIDSPPSLGVLTINSLTAATHLTIPMNPSLYSMQGTNDLMNTVAKVRKNLNHDLIITGVIINAFDSIPVITREIREEIEAAFGDLVFKTALSKSIKIEEAIANRAGVTSLKKAKVKDEIEKISRELLERLEEN